MRFDYVLFDWDNTLVESWSAIYRAWLKTLEHYGKTPVSLDEVKQFGNRSARENFSRYFQEDTAEVVKVYRQYFRDLRGIPDVLDGAVALLAYLNDQNIPCGLISNKGDALLREEVMAVNFADYFALGILGADIASKDKPDIAVYHCLFDRLGYQPQGQGAYVGDTGVDMAFAKNTGMRGILLGNTIYEGDTPFDDQFVDLPALLEALKFT